MPLSRGLGQKIKIMSDLINFIEEENSRKKEIKFFLVLETLSMYITKLKKELRNGFNSFRGLYYKSKTATAAGKHLLLEKYQMALQLKEFSNRKSPNINKIEIMRSGNVRRAKLYYLRDLKGKAARIKDKI